MIAACLAVLIYIAVIVTTDFLTPNVPITAGGGSNTLQTSIGQKTTTNDTNIRERFAAAADYLHAVDTGTA
jgi:hypothetical protein